jgi:DNA invertase Pin-like site-specific DNA recombinase
VSTREQNQAVQLDALQAAGCGRIYTEKASGEQRDRLARSIRQPIETVEDLERRKIGLRSLTEAIDTTTPGGRLVFHVFCARRVRALGHPRADRRRAGGGPGAGRKGDRPRRLSAADRAAAKALLRDPAITIEEVARRLRVGAATLYRYLPSGRGALAEDGGSA